MNQYIGKMLDNRYEILDVIGVGGMAVVYKAYCHRLHRFVAIKVLKRDLASDAEFRRRFHEEAQAVAMLSHPNIVSVYDVSRGDDLDYIVMELIDGITLKQYMQKKNGSLNWRESLYFITQIVRALGHAHSRGIIHRDIKPQNIMVLRDGSVKVADFGIARIMSAAQNTLTQEALGSVHYISPEQARGSHIDARADIYSAGVVLYEMLTGRLPFDGDSPVSVAIQHINSTPMSPRELNPEIPLGLEEITMKAMASRIDQRYMNAEAMIRDLEEFRKNPQVEFHYNLASFHGSQPMPDEPTQVVDHTTGSLGRRQRPPVRTRTAPPPPPPRRYPPEEPEEYEDSQERKRNMVIPIVVIVFLVGVGLFLWLTFFSGLFEKEPSLQAPDLTGLTMSQVYGNTAITDNFKVVQKSVEYSDKYEEGQIIDQDPKGGTEVEKGSTIYVIVSGGQEYVEMIDVKNLTYEEAVAKLQELGLKVGSPTYEPSEDVEKDKVISYTPAKGTKMLPGDTVQLVVSSGPEVKEVTVPSLTGQSLNKARDMLAAAKLKVGSIVEVASNEPAGQVVYQSVAAGSTVEEGTAIALNVSKGPEAPPIRTKTITVELPTDRETVEVRITVDDQEAYKNVVNTSVGNIYPTLSGSGVKQVCIYFDGEVVERYNLNFDQ
ncbi:MAG: Stk1 family PASTA domain-containing Ser/Thr kinase [Evtepia sp.]|uniref:Stk1 family PASTA domain-containing Ser/Thr kinase n=1 Tax=Evtepia sp. TaxID=2773933 RepID=UPI002A759746|nr:Stk1 family PASTA domain-containing Ser/Thr kinase [Evtepia sp.]MDY3015141.1 Stk1 family PASTA domain-containing Ser/Thr kinase [Evtepia sp.]